MSAITTSWPDPALAEELAWIREFVNGHGRPPRILHIGNIANNAYINAKLLIRAGIECDVICHDYYHIMGCPEWEDSDLGSCDLDQFNPDWRTVNLKGFRRPRWFAQGPTNLCIKYLVALRSGRKIRAARYWDLMQRTTHTAPSHERPPKSRRPLEVLTSLFNSRRVRYVLEILAMKHVFSRVRQRLERSDGPISSGVMLWIATSAIVTFVYFLRLLLWPLSLTCWLLQKPQPEVDRSFKERIRSIEDDFRSSFPERADQHIMDDLWAYQDGYPRWRELFTHYDLIQAYATAPILPFLANNRPFIGFEHGTLRDFTMGDTPVCRTTAISYRKANHVFITNGDCLEYAKKIGIRNYSAMLHPIDEITIRSIEGDYDGLHHELGAKYVFLCTLRHDWHIKGTDKYIRALPMLADALKESFILIMTSWGAQVEESRALARSLGVDHMIQWRLPLPRIPLVRLLKSVDVLFDQIALPHFGATAPQGIAAGVPVIMSYEPKSTEWIVAEPAPILSAWTTDDIVARAKTALDPEWRRDYARRSRHWIDTCHSSLQVVKGHIAVYRKLLEVHGGSP